MERMSVLVVDDDQALQGLLEMALLAQGHTVVTSSSAEEALARAQVEAFDLVITDIGLPGMDGLTMLQTMKAQRPEVQVIVMTGAPSIGSVLTAFRSGAFDYQLKPFRMAAMTSAVRRVAERIGGEGEAPDLSAGDRSHEVTEEMT
jgi:DNA-binding NtrC family response regulator